MRAIRVHRQGGPEGLVYEEAPRPTLAPDDALVEVHAAAISPAEFTWSIWTTADGPTGCHSFQVTRSLGSWRRWAQAQVR